MMIYSPEEIEAQAKLMAEEAHLNDPDIRTIYFFKADEEVRLLEVTPSVPKSGEMDVFYFRPAPKYGMPAPSGVAMVRPEELHSLSLPKGWGTLEQAKTILSNGRA
jgi:hypothetical protein